MALFLGGYMLGVLSSHAVIFLWMAMILTLVIFGIPILIFPLRWARRLKWSIPEDDHLTLYFGRCLGSFILVFEYAIYRAINDAGIRPFVFDMALGVSSLMIAVHLYGALKRIQPKIETIEIGFYSLLLILTILFYPVNAIKP